MIALDSHMAAIVGSTLVGVQAVFFTEYNLPGGASEDHVFTPAQAWYQRQRAKFLVGGDSTTSKTTTTTVHHDTAP
jgi:hypothetical protein